MKPARAAILPQANTTSARPTQIGRRLNLDRCASWLGLTLVLAFFLQDYSGFYWRWLEHLQADSTYRQLSGLGLVVFLAHQWHLSALRSRGLMRQAGALIRAHKLAGAMTPAIFYIHSQRLGYAYLGVLSGMLFAVFLSGLVHREIIRPRKPWFQALWISAHIGSAVIC